MLLEKATTDDEQEESGYNFEAIGTIYSRLARHRLCGAGLSIDRGSHFSTQDIPRASKASRVM